VTNGERADRLFSEAHSVAEEMRRSFQQESWNLAFRRAQEVVELVIKGLLSEMGVDYPRTHDPAPVLVETVKQRGIQADAALLASLADLSAHLAELRSPAFYQEIVVSGSEARDAVDGAERVLAFGRDLLVRLRRP